MGLRIQPGGVHTVFQAGDISMACTPAAPASTGFPVSDLLLHMVGEAVDLPESASGSSATPYNGANTSQAHACLPTASRQGR